MYLESLRIRDFRLVRFAELQLAPGANLLTGENAQGKTTVLEAISLLARGRSFRTRRENECIADHSPDVPAATAEARFLRRGLRRTASVALTKGHKTIFLDDKPLRSLADLFGTIPLVTFLPQDLDLVRGQAAVRRDYLAPLMAQFSPQGLEILKGYDRALRQRNAALRATPLSFAEIAAWEAQMAIHAVPLLHLQRGVLVELQPAVATHLDGLAAGEPLTMQLESGWSSKSAVASAIAEGQLPSDTELQGLMRDRWAERRGADIERGHTQEGPHRADLALQLQGRDARLYGSQGQTRSIALALRFAESTLTEKAAGEPPILLLDDILGELDRHRAAYFVRMLSRVGHQAILTATDAAPIQAELPIARRFKVSRGIILSE